MVYLLCEEAHDLGLVGKEDPVTAVCVCVIHDTA